MRSFLVSFALLAVVASACGGESPAGTAAAALTKLEVLGGLFNVQSDGFYVGPAPITRFKLAVTLPPLPYHNLQSASATFRIEAKVSSYHSDGGLQKLKFWADRGTGVTDHYTFGYDAWTNDGSGNPISIGSASYVVHAGDAIVGEFGPGNLWMSSNNASGLGVAFNDNRGLSFGAWPAPDTVYPLKLNANVTSCATDLPDGPGSFPTFTGYAVGGSPMTSTGPHEPVKAGCNFKQTMNWALFSDVISYNTAGTP